MSDVKPIPDGFQTITPHMVIKDASAAIEFYKKAFGAEERFRMPGPGGAGVMHAEIQIGDSIIMLCDDMPQMEQFASPSRLNGTTVGLGFYTEDCDKVFEQAIAAGATAIMPPMDAFWGDRYGKVADPFGHHWGIMTHKQDLTPEEIAEGAEKFFSECSGK